MGLAEIYNSPNNPDDLQRWAFSHAAHHRDIVRVVYTKYAVRMDEYPLDPLDPENMDAWLDLHQQMHNEQNQAMGIQGNNLSEVDWQDDGARAEWIWANADEHLRATEILGV